MLCIPTILSRVGYGTTTTTTMMIKTPLKSTIEEESNPTSSSLCFNPIAFLPLYSSFWLRIRASIFPFLRSGEEMMINVIKNSQEQSLIVTTGPNLRIVRN